MDGQWSSPMPFSNRHDLQGWMSDLNCDLRNATEFGDSVLISKVGAFVGQGAAQIETLFRHVPKNGVSKSSIMAPVIDEANAKRRCFAGTAQST